MKQKKPLKRTAFKSKSKPLKRKPIKKKKAKGRKRVRKKGILTVPKLRNKVWVEFSKFIRNEGAVGGYNTCVTCGEIFEVKGNHAGHFVHGKNKECYFDEDNVHFQCVKCNMFLSGNLLEYYPYMETEYGTATIERLKNAKTIIWKRENLEHLYNYYKKLNEKEEE